MSDKERGRDDSGNEGDDFEEDVRHTSVSTNSGRVRVAKQEIGDVSGDGSHGSDYEEGVELATNRQEAFSDDGSPSEQDVTDQKGLDDEFVEGDIGNREDVDDLKDVSELEADDKGSDDDYQVGLQAATLFLIPLLLIDCKRYMKILRPNLYSCYRYCRNRH